MRASRLAVSFLAASAVVLGASTSRADEMIIKHPGDHPDYRFEAEPHGLLGYGNVFGNRADVGVGFRGTVVIVDNGFIKKINNSVGIGFGGDFFFRKGGVTFYLPVVMQWNFWLSTHWSVMAEPGFGIVANPSGKDFFPLHPTFYAGGRYHFNDRIALTMRIGYPDVSVGVSFFL